MESSWQDLLCDFDRFLQILHRVGMGARSESDVPSIPCSTSIKICFPRDTDRFNLADPSVFLKANLLMFLFLFVKVVVPPGCI